MVHEALGHGLLSLVVPGVKAISISTVALTMTGDSRIVLAAGMIANIIVGVVSFRFFAKRPQLTNGSYFLWLFAGVNLMNIGYLAYSGILRSGDWYDVIVGLPLEPLWRLMLIVAGFAGYAGVLRLLYDPMAAQVGRSALDSRDVRRAVTMSHFAGSALILLGSVFNPIKEFIWLSGIAVGFAGTIGTVGTTGFLVVNRWIEHVKAEAATRPAVRFSAMWIIFGAIVAAAFVLILTRLIPNFTSAPTAPPCANCAIISFASAPHPRKLSSSPATAIPPPTTRSRFPSTFTDELENYGRQSLRFLDEWDVDRCAAHLRHVRAHSDGNGAIRYAASAAPQLLYEKSRFRPFFEEITFAVPRAFLGTVRAP